jgi:hypothetical protein
MKPVDICFKSMQVVFELYVIFLNLETNFKLLLEVEGPLFTVDVTTRSADVQRVTMGSYSVTRASIKNFVADLGSSR